MECGRGEWEPDRVIATEPGRGRRTAFWVLHCQTSVLIEGEEVSDVLAGDESVGVEGDGSGSRLYSWKNNLGSRSEISNGCLQRKKATAWGLVIHTMYIRWTGRTRGDMRL